MMLATTDFSTQNPWNANGTFFHLYFSWAMSSKCGVHILDALDLILKEILVPVFFFFICT